MVSTYDRRQPGYMSEDRLSRIKSGSTGTLYNQQSRMSTYNSNPRVRVTRDEDYIYGWCHHYGLTPATARVLSINGIESADELLRLDRHTVSQLAIKDNEKLLFRGALLQFKQSDYETARRQAAQGLRPQLLDRNHGISEEERRKRMELRMRLRRKKLQNNGGISLADRILMQRREANSSLSEPAGVTSNLSLPCITQSDMVSSRSVRSYYTDPTPRRSNSHHSVASKTSDYSSGSGVDYAETPQKSVKKKKEPVKQVDSSDDEEEKVVRKKDKKKKKKQDSDSEDEIEKPKKSKKKKEKVSSDSDDNEEREIKKKKKKKKKSKEPESEEEESSKKSSKKKKDKHEKEDSEDDVKESRKKKKKDKKKKNEDESDEEETRKEKKKKKKNKDDDSDSDGEAKHEKKKKKKDKDKDKDKEQSDSDDEDRKHEKKKKKKKKKGRSDSDDD